LTRKTKWKKMKNTTGFLLCNSTLICFFFIRIFAMLPVFDYDNQDDYMKHNQQMISTSKSTLFGNGDECKEKLGLGWLNRSIQEYKHQTQWPENPRKAKNKTLVILMGSIRGNEQVWKSLYGNVLDPNRADLALIAQESQYMTQSSLYKRAKFIWNYPNLCNWEDALDEMMLYSDQQQKQQQQQQQQRLKKEILTCKDIPESCREPYGLLFGGTDHCPKGSGAMVLSVRFFLLEYIKALNLQEMYDRFIITRTDQFYDCVFNISVYSPKNIWIPDGEDYDGITDRFVLVPTRHVTSVLNILPPAVQNPAAYMKYESHWGNVEQFFHLRLQQQRVLWRVARFNRMMFITTAGTEHETQTHDAQQPAIESSTKGIFSKYPAELTMANKFCNDGKQLEVS